MSQGGTPSNHSPPVNLIRTGFKRNVGYMIKKKTVLIVGAGASCEVGLPTGKDLRAQIQRKIDIRYDFNKQISGDFQIAAALTKHVRSIGQRDINPFLRCAWQLHKALPQCISIDNLLDAHRGEQSYELVGKLGIAASILEAERKSKLFFDGRDRPAIRFDAINETWYAQLLQLLTQGVAKQDIHTVLSNLTIITFNYDRCIEHFLPHALANYYGIDTQRCIEAVNALDIHHPYGVVGRLPWQPGTTDPVAFGSDEAELLDPALQLRTFSERIHDEAALNNLRTTILNANALIFLGFAFHQQNMDILKPPVRSSAQTILATTKGISTPDCAVVKQQIRELLIPGFDPDKIQTADRTCSELFADYWRTLSAI